MQSYHYTKYIVLVCAALMSFACSQDELLQPTDSVKSSLTFHPTLGGALDTRAIGDATGIDQLIVGVYEGSETLSKKLSYSDSWAKVQANGITLSLIEGRTYKLIFWAQHSSNTAYELTDDGQITVDYTEYLNGGFAKMEELDAFCATATVTVEASPNEQKTITLSRPLAQLNFADKTTQPDPAAHRSIVTFHSIPTALNPFTDAVTMTNAEDDGDDLAFTFADYDHLQNSGVVETLPVEDENGIVSNYYYVSCNYLLAPATSTNSKVAVTLEMQQPDGTPIQQFEFKDDKAIVIERNKKTNAFGALVQQPQTWSIWDGTASTEPEKDAQNRYIIDAASDLAWLSQNDIVTAGTFLQTVDIDMADKAIGSLKLPAGSTYDGGGKQLKNYQNSLFGDATELSVQHLTVDHITVPSSGVTHVGVLINTLTGSATFENVTVSNSTATTTNGAAGGFVGYISRINPNSREDTETLSVTFNDCHVSETTVSGARSEGQFVGLLRGYDNGETLQFNENCTLVLPNGAAQADGFVSPYREGNEGAWLAEIDYSKYNGWLGTEECYRGKVMYGNHRFIPCWDGATKVVPLTGADGYKLIYSAFDLANLQGTAAGNIRLMEHVDMEYDLDGASKDGIRNHVFTALSTLTTLDGNGYTIYNISIRDNYYGGFVKSENCSSTFKDVTFDGADIRVTYDATSGNGYVGTLRGFAYASTTINNVHVKNGYLYGVNKMGGLCGGVFAKLTCNGSTVDRYNIENQEVLIKDPIFSVASYEIGFYPHGEVGGLIGFIQADANISECKVTNTNLKCVGVKDLSWFGNGQIPGRHINQFIGDIRTASGQKIYINDCSVENNSYLAQTFTNNDSESKGTNFSWYYTLKTPASNSKWNIMSSCTYTKNTVNPAVELVGCCYYIYCEIYALFGKMYKKMADTKGELWIDDVQKF